MGINVTPEPDPFGDNNLACFPAGQTPSIVYAAFTGIIKGPGYMPGMPEPPNGQYTLHQDDIQEEFWRFTGGGWRVFYHSVVIGVPNSTHLRISSDEAPVFTGFWARPFGTCHTRFENDPFNPGIAPYINGFGSIWWLT